MSLPVTKAAVVPPVQLSGQPNPLMLRMMGRNRKKYHFAAIQEIQKEKLASGQVTQEVLQGGRVTYKPVPDKFVAPTPQDIFARMQQLMAAEMGHMQEQRAKATPVLANTPPVSAPITIPVKAAPQEVKPPAKTEAKIQPEESSEEEESSSEEEEEEEEEEELDSEDSSDNSSSEDEKKSSEE